MEQRPDITCRELIDFLYLYLEGELPAERFAEFEKHLSICPSCVTYIETYREAIILGKKAFVDPEVPAETCAPEELVTAILETNRRKNDN
jgi:anti-sigma factor RsiW